MLILESKYDDFEYRPCNKNFFVVQKHKAKRAGLHYDIRLTYISKTIGKCMLLSFATRKLTELLSRKTKRIAVFPTEDHSLNYAKFEGNIPDGYGAGTVEIWDRGNLEYVKFNRKEIKVKFKGDKLNGCYLFLDIRRPSVEDIYDKRKSWLFFKIRDEICNIKK